MFFFFNDTATTEIYTLSLHDALPISLAFSLDGAALAAGSSDGSIQLWSMEGPESVERWLTFGSEPLRSEEHTSELQSRQYLVCRLLLEKKKSRRASHTHIDDRLNTLP